MVSLEPGTALALRARDGKAPAAPAPRAQRDLAAGVRQERIVGSESGDVFALDQDDGSVRWQVHTDGNVKGGLALEDGILYGANYAGQVFAIRAANGSFIWQSSTQGLFVRTRRPCLLDPAVAFGRVYLGSIDGRVYSFDADNGELLWSHSTRLGIRRAGRRRHRAVQLTVYIGSKDQHFYALDAETGDVRWEKDIGGVRLAAATVLGEVVYVAGLGPNIGTSGFDVKTGKKVFESELGEYNPVISDGHRMYLTELEHPRLRARDGGRAAERSAPAPAGS